MSHSIPLKQRVEARDGLVSDAEAAGRLLREQALEALRRRDFARAEAAIARGDANVGELVENLRIYQAELHAQAEELAASQATAEERLDRFTALFTHSPVASLLIDLKGEVIEHNRRAETLFELRPRPMGRFFHRLIDPRHYQTMVRPALLEARAVGSSACDAVEFMTDAGRRLWGDLHIAALPLAGSSGETTTQFVCTVVDRTAYLNMLHELEESNQRLRVSEAFLADSAHLARIGGWDYLVEARTLRWARETRLIHEVDDAFVPTVEAAIGFYTPDSRPVIEAGFREALELGTAFDLELDIVTAGGRARRVRAVGHPEQADGRCVRVSGVFQDITQRFEAQQVIGHLTARLDVANEAGGVGVWDWDLPHDTVYLDARMRSLLGLEQAVVTNLRAALAAHAGADELERFDAAVRAALDEGQPMSLELRLTLDDVGERFIHLNGRAQFDAHQRPTRLIGCAWDCTGEKTAARLLAAKEAAEFASRAKTAFLSRMSHELRTPLNAILGFAQLMQLEAERGDLVVKPHRVELIETAARHLLDLINEVLDVSRIETGQLELRMDAVDLLALVRECLPLVQQRADAAGIRLRLEVANGRAPWVLADRLRLKEIVINLLSNAVKYNRPQGSVVVAARSEGAATVFTVRDTGVGLTASQIAGLFQPFNRVGAEATRVEGSGMGLFVSKRFVDLMGGSIEVSSEPGAGTCFTVRLLTPPPAR
jgi:two-component system, cell cycle sensor histidine kinase PleC